MVLYSTREQLGQMEYEGVRSFWSLQIRGTLAVANTILILRGRAVRVLMI